VPAKLSAELVKSWARRLDQLGSFGIGFGGGEPTLFPGFSSLCRDIHESTGLALTMTTHGHRFTSELVDQLSGNVEFIRLSMDGIGSTYERMRGRSFDHFSQKMAMVRATARFGINYVVNQDTLHDLPKAAEFAFKNGAEELLLLPEIGTEGNVTLSQKSLAELSAFVRENYRRCRLATSAHGGDCINAPMLLRSDPINETFDFMHIDALATLRPSAFSSVGIALTDGDDVMESIYRLRNSREYIAQGALQ
jgi:MoaA/NifB/PqqE/SkfB family radical SAM enzyme